MAFDAVNAALILSKGVGIPPNDMQSFNAQSQEDGIKITMTGPKNSYVYGAANNDTLVCTPAGVMVRYSDTDYPADINDGTLLGVYNENYNPVNPTEVTDNLIGLVFEQTYYFSAFPFSVDGIYNKSQAPANRASAQWVGTKGTLNVTVTVPQGYEGTLGEYTITLVDQAASGGENVSKTVNGPGMTQFGDLDGGKVYKVQLSETADLAGTLSESVTIVAGQVQEITVAYASRIGTIAINVTTQPVGMPVGAYTVTLTPTTGGEGIRQSGTDSQTLTFEGVQNGIEYNISMTAVNHYNANTNGTVTAVGGQTTQHNVVYAWSYDKLEAFTWTEIKAIADAKMGGVVFTKGDTKKFVVNLKGMDCEFHAEFCGANHDYKNAEKTEFANMSFICKETGINSGGWTGSRNTDIWEGNTIFANDPVEINSALITDEIRSVLTPVYKSYVSIKDSINYKTFRCLTWWPTYTELGGTGSDSFCQTTSATEVRVGQKAYDTYTNNTSRIKKICKTTHTTDEPVQYILPTPTDKDTDLYYYVCVNENGQFIHGYNTEYYYQVIGFCIG